MADAQRTEHARQSGCLFCPCESLYEILRGFAAHALEAHEPALGESKEVYGGLHHATVHKLFNPAFAHALNIQPGLGHKVRDGLAHHGGARHIHTAPCGLALFAHGGRLAYRTDRRKIKRQFSAGTFLRKGAHHLRYDISGALHDDRIVNHQVLGADFILVMQGRARDDHAAHLYRLQMRHGREHTRAAHLNLDVQKPGAGLLRRELEGDSPLGETCGEAQCFLQCQIIQFGHHAVNFEGQVAAHGTEGGKMLQHFPHACAQPGLRRNLEAEV